MIPKIIHYCWFGHNPKPKLAKKCIHSWKKYCPDYEIKEWNEDNIDFSIMPSYVREAYEAKKWGFVPDYIRLWLIYTYGGIYLDTDVEIVRPIDDLLKLSGFAGFETPNHVALGLGFGAEPGNPAIKCMMDSYWKYRFKNEDGTINQTPAPVLNTEILCELGLQTNGQRQEVDGLSIFPEEFFCPLNCEYREMNKTENTYSIHWYDASWWDEDVWKAFNARQKRRRDEKKLIERRRKYLSFKRKVRILFVNLLGENMIRAIINVVKKKR